jgi:hypothetical protein
MDMMTPLLLSEVDVDVMEIPGFDLLGGRADRLLL